MDNNANKIILGVAAVLTVALLALVISSGGSRGGSGGGSAPVAQQAQPQDGQPEEAITEAPAASEPSAAPEATGDYDPSAEKQMTLDELEQELSKSTVEVGDNPRDAATSASVPTTQEVSQQKADRGFGDLEIIVDFGIDGSYTDPHAIDAGTTEKYPSYKMLYTSASGVIWTVYVNEGHYLAIPLGSKDQQLGKEIILTETDYITQYDGTRNQFSDFPLASLTDEVGVHVNRIDASTLDSYTIQTLAAM